MMAIRLDLTVSQRLAVEPSHEPPAEVLLRLWGQCSHHFIDYPEFGRVEFVFCAPSNLTIEETERHGLFLNDMMFVTTEVPEHWVPFIVLQMEMERRLHLARPDGEAFLRHREATLTALVAAKVARSAEDYEAFLAWRRSVERSSIFQTVLNLTEELEEIKERAMIPEEVPERTQQKHRRMRSLRLNAGWSRLSHSKLLIRKLLDDGVLEKTYQVLCRLAGAGLNDEVAIPIAHAATAYMLSAEIDRPIITITHETASTFWIRHKDGKTMQTVEAMLRTLNGLIEVDREFVEYAAPPIPPPPPVKPVDAKPNRTETKTASKKMVETTVISVPPIVAEALLVIAERGVGGKGPFRLFQTLSITLKRHGFLVKKDELWVIDRTVAATCRFVLGHDALKTEEVSEYPPEAWLEDLRRIAAPMTKK